MQYFYALCKTYTHLETIQIHYPEVGHSFLPNDRAFGQIEKNIRKAQIFDLNGYSELIKNTCKDFEVVDVNQNMFHDFSAHLSQYFLPPEKYLSDAKWKISQYKLIHIAKNCIYASRTHSFEDADVFDVENIHENDFSLDNLNPLYLTRIPLDQHKYDSLQGLSEKYVPQENRQFYAELPFSAGATSIKPSIKQEESNKKALKSKFFKISTKELNWFYLKTSSAFLLNIAAPIDAFLNFLKLTFFRENL